MLQLRFLIGWCFQSLVIQSEFVWKLATDFYFSEGWLFYRVGNLIISITLNYQPSKIKLTLTCMKTVSVSRLAQRPQFSSLVSLVFWLLLVYAWKPSSMAKSLIHEPSRLNSNVPIWLANDRANEKDNPKIPKVPRKKKIIKNWRKFWRYWKLAFSNE